MPTEWRKPAVKVLESVEILLQIRRVLLQAELMYLVMPQPVNTTITANAAQAA